MTATTIETERPGAIGIDSWALFFALMAGAWLIHGLTGRYPGYVHHDTAETAMWAHVGFQWGYQKHPPLLAWIALATSKVMPLGFVSFTLLSVVNLVGSAFAVWRIALLTIGRERAPVALVLHLLSPYLTFQALKLNHNSLLISLWPLTAWAFLVALRNPGLRQGLVLGLAAGAGLLGKSEMGLLLLGCLAAALASPERARLFRSPAPYAAGVVAAALVLPHILWLMQSGANDLAAGLAQRAPKGALPVTLLLNNLLLLAPALIGGGLLAATVGRADAADATDRRTLWLLVAVPYVATVLIVMVLGLRGSATWTQPIFALIPVLLASYIAVPRPRQSSNLGRLLLAGLALIAVSGLPVLAISFAKGEESAIDARGELAGKGIELWRQATGRPPRIIAGNHRIVMAAMLVADGAPLGWGEPDVNRPYWIRQVDTRKLGFVAICEEGGLRCQTFARRLAAEQNGLTCQIQHTRRLGWMTAPSAKAVVVIVPPDGTTVPDVAGCTRVARDQ